MKQILLLSLFAGYAYSVEVCSLQLENASNGKVSFAVECTIPGDSFLIEKDVAGAGNHTRVASLARAEAIKIILKTGYAAMDSSTFVKW